MKKQILKQLGMTLLSLMLICYLVLQLALNVGDIVDIEYVNYVTALEKEKLNAYIFRDEKPLESATTGISSYFFKNGEKVRNGVNVAVTYSQASDASVQERIKNINEKISILEQSAINTGTTTTYLKKLNKNIISVTCDFLQAVDDGKIEEAIRYKCDLTILNNRRSALISSQTNYNSQITALKKERSSLESSLSGISNMHKANMGGYFYSNLDGYENIFTMKKLKNLSAKKFDELSALLPDQNLIDNSVGKLVISPDWYLVFETDKRTASKYREGSKCDFAFPCSAGMIIDMKLKRKISQTDSDKVILIFTSNKMPDGFNYIRMQTVELIKNTYEGLKISASSLRKNNGETGVYALDGNSGNKVVFKKANVLYEENGYYICALPEDRIDKNDKAYVSRTNLSLYDAVIYSGKNLYEGKILQ